MRFILIGLVSLAVTGCVDRQAACIANAQAPVERLTAQIAALDAQLVAGEIEDRRAGVMRLAELEAAKARTEASLPGRIAACRQREVSGL